MGDSGDSIKQPPQISQPYVVAPDLKSWLFNYGDRACNA